MKAIADSPTPEMYESGMEIDCQCARCGSSVDTDHCDGKGVWHRCMSSSEWCEANPIPGREDIKRGKIEWFTID